MSEEQPPYKTGNPETDDAMDIVKVTELELAIIDANTQEANVIRRQVSALQKLIGDRLEAYHVAWEGGKAYCEASAKAGEEWEKLSDKRPQGQNTSSQNFAKTISVSDAGFASSQDATVCVRVGELHQEDRRTYYDECANNDKIPTLGGLYTVWRELYGDIDPSRPWLRVYNIWNFQKLDEHFGQDHPGRIPAQINMNLNYYYTKPGDLVVDLFAGGGTTLDVCKYHDDDFGNRSCIGYDIDPKRQDIQKWDLIKDRLPDLSKAKLVFLDPPYWKQKQGEYSADKTNLANMPLNIFHGELSKIVAQCLAAIPAESYVALIIGPTQESLSFFDHAAEMMCAVGNPYHRIIVPYSTQIHGGNYVSIAKEKKRWLYLFRDLMIWKS